MTTANSDSSAQRTATRAPVGKPIKLQFDDSLDVAQGVCQNISIGGMFILVDNTRLPGSLVRFELSVDESTAIRGLGEVVWSQTRLDDAADREPSPRDPSPREPGVGIKFRFLEQRDRQLIFKLVSQHIKERLAKRQTLDTESTLASRPAEAQAPSSRPVPVAGATPEVEESPPTPEAVSPAPPAENGHEAFDAELESLREAPAWAMDSTDPMPATAALLARSEDSESPGELAAELPLGGSSGTFSEGGDRGSWGGPEVLDGVDLDEGSPVESALGDDLEPDLDPPSRRPRRRGRRSPLMALAAAILGVAAVAVFLWRGDLFGGGRDRSQGDDPAAVEADRGPPPGADETSPPRPADAPDPPPPDAATAPPADAAEQAAVLPPPGEVRRTPPPPTSDFQRVLDVSWRRAAGGLEVIIETDGAIPEGRFRHFRLGGDNPREVIRMLGVRERYDRGELAVGGPLVRKIRTGFHRKRAGDELHVVLDLEDPEARIEDLRARDARLIARISRP